MIELITVCAACDRISCWLGEFMCEDAKYANVRRITREEFDALGLERPEAIRRLRIAEGREKYGIS